MKGSFHVRYSLCWGNWNYWVYDMNNLSCTVTWLIYDLIWYTSGLTQKPKRLKAYRIHKCQRYDVSCTWRMPSWKYIYINDTQFYIKPRRASCILIYILRVTGQFLAKWALFILAKSSLCGKSEIALCFRPLCT